MAFWRKETASIDQKYTYEKLPKYLSRALPPSSGQNLVRFPDPFADGSFKVRRGPCLDKTQKTAFFSQESVPCAPRLHCFIGGAWNQMDPKDQYLTKIQVLGKIGPFLGQNSNFCGRNQKFSYQHSGKAPQHLVCIVFWSGMRPNGPKMTCLGQKSIFGGERVKPLAPSHQGTN